jgi:hypothetical protein
MHVALAIGWSRYQARDSRPAAATPSTSAVETASPATGSTRPVIEPVRSPTASAAPLAGRPRTRRPHNSRSSRLSNRFLECRGTRDTSRDPARYPRFCAVQRTDRTDGPHSLRFISDHPAGGKSPLAAATRKVHRTGASSRASPELPECCSGRAIEGGCRAAGVRRQRWTRHGGRRHSFGASASRRSGAASRVAVRIRTGAAGWHCRSIHGAHHGFVQLR